MRNSYKVASIGGIEIYVHWSWVLAFIFISWSLGDYYYGTYHSWNAATSYIVGAVSAILLFVTVLLHELSHSFTARARGLPVSSITLFIFGGISNLTREPETPGTELLVAIAGPLASAVLSGLFFVGYLLASSAPSQVLVVLGYLSSINLILAVFNLIPGFPLDGGRVLRALIWMATGSLRRATRIAGTVGSAIGYLFILGGVLEALVLGQVFAGIWLAFIGWFLSNAAGTSYQQATVDRMLMGVDVRDVMDPAPPSALVSMSVDTLVHQMLETNQRAVPVDGPDGRLIGLVTLSDVNKVAREEWTVTSTSNVMTHVSRLRVVHPSDDLRSALRVLAENGFNQLPVVEDERLVGMLNRAHVVQYLHLRQRLGLQEPSSHDENVAAS